MRAPVVKATNGLGKRAQEKQDLQHFHTSILALPIESFDMENLHHSNKQTPHI